MARSRARKTRSRSRTRKTRTSRRKTRARVTRVRVTRVPKQDNVDVEFYFQVWYTSRPTLIATYRTDGAVLKLDDDDDWLYYGHVFANNEASVKRWLKSLGNVKRYSGTTTNMLEVSRW
jgi:hypothetical protein